MPFDAEHRAIWERIYREKGVRPHMIAQTTDHLVWEFISNPWVNYYLGTNRPARVFAMVRVPGDPTTIRTSDLFLEGVHPMNSKCYCEEAREITGEEEFWFKDNPSMAGRRALFLEKYGK